MAEQVHAIGNAQLGRQVLEIARRPRQCRSPHSARRCPASAAAGNARITLSNPLRRMSRPTDRMRLLARDHADHARRSSPPCRAETVLRRRWGRRARCVRGSTPIRSISVWRVKSLLERTASARRKTNCITANFASASPSGQLLAVGIDQHGPAGQSGNGPGHQSLRQHASREDRDLSGRVSAKRDGGKKSFAYISGDSGFSQAIRLKRSR